MKRIVQIAIISIFVVGLFLTSQGGRLMIHNYFAAALPSTAPVIDGQASAVDLEKPVTEATEPSVEPTVESKVQSNLKPVPNQTLDHFEKESKDQIQKPNLPSPSSQPTPTPTTTPILITDPNQLLVLVNKHHALPANYQPAQLVVPQVPFYFTEDSPKKLLRPEAATALERLFHRAAQDGIILYGASGYRSYQRQNSLFNHYTQAWGEEAANRLSARPGQSEHQTGLAMDITSRRVNFILVKEFGQTPEGIWIVQHAPQFGFILRYPKEKEQITGYQYEPWHLRYVGISAAQQISANKLTLEEYLLTRQNGWREPDQDRF